MVVDGIRCFTLIAICRVILLSEAAYTIAILLVICTIAGEQRPCMSEESGMQFSFAEEVIRILHVFFNEQTESPFD